jgi:glycosyltransferase involved in cell wall biosynthesis
MNKAAAKVRKLSKLSVVVPCHNESEVLEEFVSRTSSVCSRMGCAYEIIIVNDGSTDDTLSVARCLALKHPAVKVVNLLRNFGHQAAATAGLDLCDGDAAVLIDADLQDPPEVIAEMVGAWSKGADVAYGLRRSRAGETAFKLWTAKLFYRILKSITRSDIPADAGDFRLMDKKVVQALKDMRERHRFIRGMVSWVGGVQKPVAYDRQPRHAGQTKYPFKKMMAFAIDAVASFSVVPLRFVTALAIVIIAFAVISGFVVLLVRIFFPHYFIPGFPAILVTIMFFGGVQLLALGIIGEYLGRMYESVKARPLYIVENIYSGDSESADS